MSRARLIIAIVTTFLDDILILVLLFWVLPKLGINLPLALVIIISVLWTAFAAVLYIAGTRALRRKPLSGLTDMTGTRGKVVKTLQPEGMVRVKGELWAAKSSDSETISKGEEIIVTGQQGLNLEVHRIKPV